MLSRIITILNLYENDNIYYIIFECCIFFSKNMAFQALSSFHT